MGMNDDPAEGPRFDPGTVVRVLTGTYKNLYGPIVEVDHEANYKVLVPVGLRKTRQISLKEDEIRPEQPPPVSTTRFAKVIGLPTRTLTFKAVLPERVAQEIREASNTLGREFVQKLIEDRLGHEILKLFKGKP